MPPIQKLMPDIGPGSFAASVLPFMLSERPLARPARPLAKVDSNAPGVARAGEPGRAAGGGTMPFAMLLMPAIGAFAVDAAGAKPLAPPAGAFGAAAAGFFGSAGADSGSASGAEGVTGPGTCSVSIRRW